jgi:hypothetical protein
MHGGLYLMGSDGDISWDSATASRLLESPEAMRDIGDAPDYYRIAGRSWLSILASMQWLKDGDVDRFSGDARLITDDHPRTEYYLLRQMFASGDQSVSEARLRKLGP